MKKDGGNRDILKALAMFTQLGLSMAGCCLAGVLLGAFLDRRMGTAPWLLIVCSILGAAAAFKVMYDLVIKEWMK